jgi:hypothetical protein
LFGFDFAVGYRLGRLNTLADALSRWDMEEGLVHDVVAHALSVPMFVLINDIRTATAATMDAR